MKDHLLLHDQSGNCIAKTKGGFLLPLLASLAGPFLKGLFGHGVNGISHNGVHYPLHHGPMTKDIKHQIARLFEIPQAMTLLGANHGSGAVGFGLEHGEVSYPGGAVGFGAVGFGKGAVGFGRKRKAGKGFSVDQAHSKNYSGFPMSSKPQFPVNLAY